MLNGRLPNRGLLSDAVRDIFNKRSTVSVDSAIWLERFQHPKGLLRNAFAAAGHV